MNRNPPQNVLLIHSDQHRYDCVARHGLREHVRTPNLDRLCAEGASFDRAYATIPICTPARASLLTGTWPTRHGSFCIPTSELNRAARPELPTILQCLKQRGYRNGWVGKYHGELDITGHPGTDEGVDAFVPLWNYGDFRKSRGIPDEPAESGLFGDENTETPADSTRLAWQADQVTGLLRQYGAGDAPFFLRWDPPEPHLPCRPASRFADLFEASEIPPWPSFPDGQSGKPAAQKRQKRIWGLEDWTWEDWQPIVRLYYGIIAELDYHIGRVLDTLDALGLAENTLVIYSTDHGDYCGGHGQLDKHFNMYDDVCRVPLILRSPGRIAPGIRCDAFASNEIDIAHTILAAANCTIPESFDGRNLLRMAAEPGYRPRDVAYAQYFGTETGAYSCRMIRDARYKFVYHPVGDMNEFYNLESDPGELQNRIEDPDLHLEVAQLMARLWDVMKEEGDPLANKWTAVELRGEKPLSAGLPETSRSNE